MKYYFTLNYIFSLVMVSFIFPPKIGTQVYHVNYYSNCWTFLPCSEEDRVLSDVFVRNEDEIYASMLEDTY